MRLQSTVHTFTMNLELIYMSDIKSLEEFLACACTVSSTVSSMSARPIEWFFYAVSIPWFFRSKK